VSFQDAVTTVYTQKYADFSGRARRSEYWFAYLAFIIAGIVVGIIGGAIGSKIPGLLLDLAVFLPILGAGVRRLHDTNKSGWWMLIALTGIGIIVLIIFFVLDSDPNTNQHGPSPKAAPEYGQANANWGQN
jgi:uncharacterized membrane protein YhaH (DUF805 family)